jgi:hypothetical protein
MQPSGEPIVPLVLPASANASAAEEVFEIAATETVFPGDVGRK